MYEVWYTQFGIPAVIFKPTLERAIKAGVDVLDTDGQVLDALVGPEGEIRTDLVHQRAIEDLRDQKNQESKNNWAVEVKAAHRDDVWGIYAERPTEEAALGVSAELASLDSGRVRVRQL